MLDNKRLGKQRVETLQILNTLAGRSNAWQNHPAVRMWKGYEPALIDYGIAICEEWRGRGYKDTCLEKIAAFRSSFPENKQLPPWLGKRKFHHGQQAKLLRKLPAYYGNHFSVSPELEFEWPVPLLLTRTKTASPP